MRSSRVDESAFQEVQRILSEFSAEQTSRGLVVSLPADVLFDFDRSDVRSDAQAALEKMGKVLQYYAEAPVAINGHTDAKGDDAYNQALSERRAMAVRDYLVSRLGVPGQRLSPAGFGESQPVAPNARSDGSDDPAGRQQNRRVEIVISTQ